MDANIYRIENMDDYRRLPKVRVTNEVAFIDFEECVRQGIDAVEYAYTAAHQDRNEGDEMDMAMLGWDCDSILIMNPDIIKKAFWQTAISVGVVEGGFLIIN